MTNELMKHFESLDEKIRVYAETSGDKGFGVFTDLRANMWLDVAGLQDRHAKTGYFSRLYRRYKDEFRNLRGENGQ